MNPEDVVAILRARGLNPTGGNGRWTSRCPAHEDRHASLSIGRGKSGAVLLRCFAGCGFDAIGAALGVRQQDLFADPGHSPVPDRPLAPVRKLNPPRLESGTDADRDQLARLRGLPREGIDFAADFLGVLGFGNFSFRGFDGFARCWVLSDASLRCFQERRLDGQPCRWFSHNEERAEKSFNLPGSTTKWPVGLTNVRGDTPFVLLCEGGPDLLAASAICARFDRGASVIPVAMLGASATIEPDALAILAGCRVRLIPHIDEAGGRSVSRWGDALVAAGASVDVFDLHDEIPAGAGKDLNDFCRVVSADRWEGVVSWE